MSVPEKTNALLREIKKGIPYHMEKARKEIGTLNKNNNEAVKAVAIIGMINKDQEIGVAFKQLIEAVMEESE